jgi:hypothetical protein
MTQFNQNALTEFTICCVGFLGSGRSDNDKV